MFQQNETLEKNIRNLQENFNQILVSGCHYYTQEISNHIKHINNALDNIKLDHEFQRGSKNWSKQFDSNEMKSNQTSKTKTSLVLSFTRLISFRCPRINWQRTRSHSRIEHLSSYNNCSK